MKTLLHTATAFLLAICWQGCVTLHQAQDGTLRVTATGNGLIMVAPDGTVKAIASQSAETYGAFGTMAGNIIGSAAKAAVKP